MAYPQRLKLVCGPFEWTGTLSQRPWTPSRMVLGGSDESWAGVPESWKDRTDRMLGLRPRCRESEWAALADLLEYAHENASAILTVWPDAAVPGTSYDTYLVSPRLGEEIKPEDGQIPGFYEISIKVRTTDGSAIDPEYFG